MSDITGTHDMRNMVVGYFFGTKIAVVTTIPNLKDHLRVFKNEIFKGYSRTSSLSLGYYTSLDSLEIEWVHSFLIQICEYALC